MANFYLDTPELKHHLNHPLMKRIVELKERNYTDKDTFEYAPIDFEDLWAASVLVELETTGVRIAPIDDLIRLKRMAGRPQDLIDIEQLEEIRTQRGATDGH